MKELIICLVSISLFGLALGGLVWYDNYKDRKRWLAYCKSLGRHYRAMDRLRYGIKK